MSVRPRQRKSKTVKAEYNPTRGQRSPWRGRRKYKRLFQKMLRQDGRDAIREQQAS